MNEDMRGNIEKISVKGNDLVAERDFGERGFEGDYVWGKAKEMGMIIFT